MQSAQALPDPDVLLGASIEGESRLRSDYLSRGDSQTLFASSEGGARTVVELSAIVLELIAVSVCLLEVLEEQEIETAQDSTQPPSFFIDRIRAVTGLDIIDVFATAKKRFQIATAPDRLPRRPSVQTSVPFVRSVLEVCPVKDLERVGNSLGIEAIAHACRRAYDALRAFVLRNDPAEQSRLRVVGDEYSKGALSIDKIALLLGSTSSEAIAELESHGYRRTLEAIALSEGERNERIGMIRTDRLRRQGEPDPSQEAVRKDVVASARIEGIDARQWVP